MGKPRLRKLNCIRCEKLFERFTSARPKYCDPCRSKRKTEIMQERHRLHPEYAERIKQVGQANRGVPNLAITGEKHPLWKGDDVGIDALHFWVIRHKPDPGFCEHCSTTEARLEWSNISQEYKRDLSDWQRLCRSCHLKYDNKMGVRNGNKKAVHGGIL